ncbi:hypothetical protein BJ508DRAFT_312885 [Ascobolus immersus RN42]|uniref:Uncharacterized protein n=1 Tax=Ascobolus immersus RN42 TaxID=1160509 RepID=A0A3N4HMF7_ASCIM|nr:hypothetical protein BJ508DRAFT_312885 [Ascobolus immersus RN42]
MSHIPVEDPVRDGYYRALGLQPTPKTTLHQIHTAFKQLAREESNKRAERKTLYSNKPDYFSLRFSRTSLQWPQALEVLSGKSDPVSSDYATVPLFKTWQYPSSAGRLPVFFFDKIPRILQLRYLRYDRDALCTSTRPQHPSIQSDYKLEDFDVLYLVLNEDTVRRRCPAKTWKDCFVAQFEEITKAKMLQLLVKPTVASTGTSIDLLVHLISDLANMHRLDFECLPYAFQRGPESELATDTFGGYFADIAWRIGFFWCALLPGFLNSKEFAEAAPDCKGSSWTTVVAKVQAIQTTMVSKVLNGFNIYEDPRKWETDTAFWDQRNTIREEIMMEEDEGLHLTFAQDIECIYTLLERNKCRLYTENEDSAYIHQIDIAGASIHLLQGQVQANTRNEHGALNTPAPGKSASMH